MSAFFTATALLPYPQPVPAHCLPVSRSGSYNLPCCASAHLPAGLEARPLFRPLFLLKKRRLLLFFEKPVTAVRVSRRSFSSGSPIFNDKISRTNISNGIAAENGLPESPINKTPSFSAASVGIPGVSWQYHERGSLLLWKAMPLLSDLSVPRKHHR